MKVTNGIVVGLTAMLALGVVLGPSSAHAKKKGKAAQRQFRFDYGATLTDVPAGAKVRVWLPVPQSGQHQKVKPLDQNLPAKASVGKESKYGNKILHFETKGPKGGKIQFETSYLVKRREAKGLPSASGTSAKPTKLSQQQRELFLSANQKVPLGGKPAELIKGQKLTGEPLSIGKKLYERVEGHMTYDKSRPGYGTGDAVWACDSKFGNCTDFHSLFISLARTSGLPSRFEIGFPLPVERGSGEIGGYHCWAQFYVDGHGWVPVDISEADKHPELKPYYFGNLTENRVTFSMGRDIDLVPKQKGPPLNFFVYPYVEVDGKPWPKEKIKLSFRYEDQQ